MNRSNIISCVLAGAVVALLVMNISLKKRAETVKLESGEWSKIEAVLDQISANYVDTIDYKTLNEEGITAVLSKLDPHSLYLPPVDLEKSETELKGNFDGIGIQFNVPNDTAIVLEVIAGGPSEKIGLLPGDRLIKVDSLTIAGVKMNQDVMVSHIKGPAGSKVTITVLRSGEEIPFEITRGKIPINSVDAYFMVGDTTGYIRLSKFARTTYKEFLTASIDLLAHGMTEMIVDLRGNTGGYMDQALNLSNAFLSEGDGIVYMEGLHRSREEYHADGKGALKEVDLKVLIDDSSASSSEIFAGAIQDNDRGVIIGRRSFGKGLVQEPIFFSDGSGVRLTVARFYTPSGRCIQKPYSDDYDYDLVKRYRDGEMLEADSIKVDTTKLYKTVHGRTVYGGGGIIPDVFVPVDTTRVSDFYLSVSRKATAMRFASSYFDSHKEALSAIEDFETLLNFFETGRIEKEFLDYASKVDALKPKDAGEWNSTRPYLMPQVRALVGRYSKLGENAFYHLYMDYDNVMEEALKPHKLEIDKNDL